MERSTKTNTRKKIRRITSVGRVVIRQGKGRVEEENEPAQEKDAVVEEEATRTPCSIG